MDQIRTLNLLPTLLLSGLIALSSVGCGGPVLLPVAGRVVFDDGQPVRTGRIEYSAVEGSARAMSEIDRDGRFTLITAEGDAGLPAGQYEVIVVQLVITEDLSLSEHEDHGRPVPRKYADYTTSGLTATVSEANAASQEVVLQVK